MNNQKIYVLHKNGANEHYTALEYLLKEKNNKLIFREFSIFGNFFKSIFRLDWELFIKQCKNTLFILKLLFSRDLKIVLGIAPFDPKLLTLRKILRNHELYYHTSWTCWNGSFHPKRKKNTAKVMENWKAFLENDTKHIFTVTKKSKDELINNYLIPNEKISVVYHSLHPIFYNRDEEFNKKSLSFIYLGRLLPQKGIQELLDFFSENHKASLTIVGKGKEKELVEGFAEDNKNINYHCHISDKSKIASLIAKHEYLVLNSKKTHKWEELFGLVVIESMALGTIPIATEHSGPKEIINNDTGFLCKEGEIRTVISNLLKKKFSKSKKFENAIKESKKYHLKNIAKRWEPILN